MKLKKRFKKEFNKVEEQVYHILETCPSARKSDFYLYIELLCVYYDADEYDPIRQLKYCDGFYPAFETVTRARRYVQSYAPQLKEKDTAESREEREEEVREFFKSDE